MSAPPAVDTDSLAAICRLNKRISELKQQITVARELNHELTTAAGYRETAAAGYIDRSFLEADRA